MNLLTGRIMDRLWAVFDKNDRVVRNSIFSDKRAAKNYLQYAVGNASGDYRVEECEVVIKKERKE
jgi:hypothetical protein